MHWSFSGFRPGKTIYGHYIHGRQVALARFGRAHGPCGMLKVRARFYPGGHPRSRSYRLQLDQSRHYSKRARPRVLTSISAFFV
ncbi:MAG: hypothetical protein ACRDMX_12710 [Solirubrobacteraceae bacterium]